MCVRDMLRKVGTRVQSHARTVSRGVGPPRLSPYPCSTGSVQLLVAYCLEQRSADRTQVE